MNGSQNTDGSKIFAQQFMQKKEPIQTVEKCPFFQLHNRKYFVHPLSVQSSVEFCARSVTPTTSSDPVADSK